MYLQAIPHTISTRHSPARNNILWRVHEYIKRSSQPANVNRLREFIIASSGIIYLVITVECGEDAWKYMDKHFLNYLFVVNYSINIGLIDAFVTLKHHERRRTLKLLIYAFR